MLRSGLILPAVGVTVPEESGFIKNKRHYLAGEILEVIINDWTALSDRYVSDNVDKMKMYLQGESHLLSLINWNC